MKNFVLITALFLLSAASAFGQDSSVKLSGQVVCSVCWFEEEDRNATPYGNSGDLKCAADCSEKGESQSLAVKNEKGEFVLYQLEKGAFKPAGKDFLEFVPKIVEVEGTLREADGKKILKVNSLTVLRSSAPEGELNNDASLTLNDMTGAPQSLATYKGRFVVLNFWATWCGPCKKEMPDLVKIQNEYGPLGVQVVGASADEEEEKGKVLQFVRQMKINFPIWLGAKTTDTTRFGVGAALPSTVIIDREGKIIWRRMGAIKAADLRQELDNLLSVNVETKKNVAKNEDNSSLVPA